MTIVITILATENAKTRRYRKRGELMAKRRDDAELARKIDAAFTKLSEGCSSRVMNAVNPIVPNMQQMESGSCCLPDVSLYRAGHRKQADAITAR
ncbi:transcriptional antitermination N peptide [Martelella alba]|uniref:Uncharacterized protein n=1 Tax=Martelella alba TaxID=2590451 RepID=A0ABY2SF78_9HYPH|nr:hypothetical protein [Martelella alba]TKI03549.1 hypothetical protein FCN80_20945 [Martelella alba]